jgi:hypothetical protein
MGRMGSSRATEPSAALVDAGSAPPVTSVRKFLERRVRVDLGPAAGVGRLCIAQPAASLQSRAKSRFLSATAGQQLLPRPTEQPDAGWQPLLPAAAGWKWRVVRPPSSCLRSSAGRLRSAAPVWCSRPCEPWQRLRAKRRVRTECRFSAQRRLRPERWWLYSARSGLPRAFPNRRLHTARAHVSGTYARTYAGPVHSAACEYLSGAYGCAHPGSNHTTEGFNAEYRLSSERRLSPQCRFRSERRLGPQCRVRSQCGLGPQCRVRS